MREVDEARLRKAREDDPLHHPDERTLVAEVGREGDDAGGLGAVMRATVALQLARGTAGARAPHSA